MKFFLGAMELEVLVSGLKRSRVRTFKHLPTK